MKRASSKPGQLPTIAARRRFMRLATHVVFTAACIMVASSAGIQAQGQMRRVGMLWLGREQDPRIMKTQAAFLDRLRGLGYIDGKTIQIHARYAGGVLDRLPGLARELVALKVDVIVAVAVAASVAAREATAGIPIVMVNAGNPVGARLIESLARPGGNVTGTTSMLPDLGGKQIEMAASGVTVGASHRIPVEPYQCRNRAYATGRRRCRPTDRT